MYAWASTCFDGSGPAHIVLARLVSVDLRWLIPSGFADESCMRLAMVIGEQRLAQEQRMLNRLAVGLMAEGVQLTRIVPEGLPAALLGEGERRMALAPRIETTMKSMPWMRKFHVRKVAEVLEEQPPDVLYLLGRDAWAFGMPLAMEIERPALLEVWSATQASALPRPGPNSPMAGVIAPCAGLADVLRGRVPREMVSLVPMGVGVTHRFVRVLAEDDRPPAIVVLGGARDMHAYAAAIDGLARVQQRHSSMQIFLELRGPREHDIWRLAERAGLLGAVSAIGSAAQHHALLMRCDIVLLPERYGELRSILLEAMAMALPTVAAADHALDMLVDGETARLVTRDSAELWEQHILGLMGRPAEAQAMGGRARDLVARQHGSTEQIAAMLETLERIAGSDAYVFPKP